MPTPFSSQNTVREYIIEAMLQLLEKKGFDSITITELVQRAGVSRNSFYRNFRDKEDVITQYLVEQKAIWWERFCKHSNRQVVLEVFQFLDSLRPLILLLQKNDLLYLLEESLRISPEERQKECRSEQYRQAAAVGMIWGLAKEWISFGMEESPAQLMAMFADAQNKTP